MSRLSSFSLSVGIHFKQLSYCNTTNDRIYAYTHIYIAGHKTYKINTSTYVYHQCRRPQPRLPLNGALNIPLFVQCFSSQANDPEKNSYDFEHTLRTPDGMSYGSSLFPLNIYNSYFRHQDIATGYMLHDQRDRVRVPVGAGFFSSPCRPDRFWGPPSPLHNGYQGLFPTWVKRPGHETNLSPRTSSEVKNRFTPPCLHGAVLS
jgi:hypothetical protein